MSSSQGSKPLNIVIPSDILPKKNGRPILNVLDYQQPGMKNNIIAVQDIFQIQYSHWLCAVIDCIQYSHTAVAHVTLPKAVVSTAKLFAV